MEDATEARVVSKCGESRWRLGLEARLGLEEPMLLGKATDDGLGCSTLLGSDRDLDWDLTVGEELGEISPHSLAGVSGLKLERCGEAWR
jgi:hypothetical protein